MDANKNFSKWIEDKRENLESTPAQSPRLSALVRICPLDKCFLIQTLFKKFIHWAMFSLP